MPILREEFLPLNYCQWRPLPTQYFLIAIFEIFGLPLTSSVWCPHSSGYVVDSGLRLRKLKAPNDLKDKQDAVGDGRLCLQCRHPSELDQTTLSHFRLVPSPGEHDETYSSFLILAHSLSCEKT